MNDSLKQENEQQGNSWIRQWRLVQSLIDSREGRSIKELSEILGASILTIRRDLETIEAVFGKLHSRNRAHGEKVYSFNSETFSFMPTFNRDEMIALAVAETALAPLGKTCLTRGLDSGFLKMEKVVDRQDIEYAKQVKRAFYVKRTSNIGYQSVPEDVEKILKAIIEKRILKVEYHSPQRRGKKSYEIHPYSFLYSNGLLYVVGWSSHREDVCTWRVDRFLKIRMLQRTFVVPREFDMLKIVSTGSYPFLKEDETTTATVLFKKDIRPEVLAEDSMILRMEKRPRGQTIAEVIVDNKKTFFRWLLQYEDHATIVGPQSLCNEMKKRLRKIWSQYNSKKSIEGNTNENTAKSRRKSNVAD